MINIKNSSLLVVFLVCLFSCSSKDEQRKERQIYNYTCINNNEIRKSIDTICSNLDDSSNLVRINIERIKLINIIDSIKRDLIKVTGGINSKANYAGNREYKIINNYVLGKEGFVPVGGILFNELSEYYNLFDTKFYKIPYLNWESTHNYVYRYDKSESYKTFSELNLADSSLLQLLITLEIFKKDILSYELLELYKVKK